MGHYPKSFTYGNSLTLQLSCEADIVITPSLQIERVRITNVGGKKDRDRERERRSMLSTTPLYGPLSCLSS